MSIKQLCEIVARGQIPASTLAGRFYVILEKKLRTRGFRLLAAVRLLLSQPTLCPRPYAQAQKSIKKAFRFCLSGVAATRHAVLRARLAPLAAAALAGLGCSSSVAQANEPLDAVNASQAREVFDWNTFVIDLVAANQPPPMQTHTLAVVHIAVHDALNAIDLRYQPYEYVGSAPGASVAAAVTAAAHDTLVQLLPLAAAEIDAQYAAKLASIPDGADKYVGVWTGQAAAAAILALRSGDDLAGALGKRYTPGPADPGVYQPTPPLNFVLLAGWGEVTPFAMCSNTQFRSPTPFSVTSNKYSKDYKEVKDYGSVGSTKRSAEQTETARFWFDVATKEWHRAAQKGLADVSADEWQAARALALVSIAMADGVIACAETKFNFNRWRPITAIRAGDSDGNNALRGDPDWEPLCVTPPFPEYNSTHAVTGAAAARVLALTIGDRHTFTINSPTLTGVSRTYNRFSVAAAEEGISRIFCGIHFRNAMNAGLVQGRQVARHVFTNLLKPVDDSASSASVSPPEPTRARDARRRCDPSYEFEALDFDPDTGEFGEVEDSGREHGSKRTASIGAAALEPRPTELDAEEVAR